LMLSVAGHLTIFQTRTRGPWWSTRPAMIVLIAVFGTQIFATLVAVYGAWVVTPLGWEMAGLVWGYAIAWFLLTDPVKLLAYRVLDRLGDTDEPKAADKPQAIAPAPVSSVPTRPSGSASQAKPEAAPASGAKSDKANARTEPVPAAEAARAAAPTPPGRPALQPGTAAANVAALLDRKLGDVLLAGVLKNPAEAGHLITDAIAEAEAPVTGKPAEAKPAEAASPPLKAAE